MVVSNLWMWPFVYVYVCIWRLQRPQHLELPHPPCSDDALKKKTPHNLMASFSHSCKLGPLAPRGYKKKPRLDPSNSVTNRAPNCSYPPCINNACVSELRSPHSCSGHVFYENWYDTAASVSCNEPSYLLTY